MSYIITARTGGFLLPGFHVPELFNFGMPFRIIKLMMAVKHVVSLLKTRGLYLAYVLFTGIYFGLVYANNAAQPLLQGLGYEVSTERWLGVATRLPLALVWLASLYGYIRFQRYISSVRTGKDAEGLHYIGKGLLTLTIGLPFTYIIANLLLMGTQYGLLDSSLRSALVNYPPLIMQLCAFGLISRGAFSLASTLERHASFVTIGLYGLFAMLIGITYSFLVASNGVDIARDATDINSLYHMPNWLVVIGLVLPFMFAWSLGIRAVFDLSRFQHFVKGSLYRRSLMMITNGLGIVVSVSIIIQCISTQTRQSLFSSTISMFIVAYALYFIYALGFLLIARGARRLQKIEEA